MKFLDFISTSTPLPYEEKGEQKVKRESSSVTLLGYSQKTHTLLSFMQNFIERSLPFALGHLFILRLELAQMFPILGAKRPCGDELFYSCGLHYSINSLIGSSKADIKIIEEERKVYQGWTENISMPGLKKI